LVRGLYAANLGMTVQMKRMDVVSNNIANVNTTAFKKDSVATQSFAEELMKRLDDPGTRLYGHAVNVGKFTSGVFVDTVFTNFSSGPMRITENALDLAIDGDGFFVVQVADNRGRVSEKYTRDGTFTLAGDRLLTRDGARVVGADGSPVVIPEGFVSIDNNGAVFADGEYVNTLKLVDFKDKSTLRSARDNMYVTTADSEFIEAKGLVVQGALEGSNVNSALEMVDMITINRAYEANQRAILTIDATLGRAVNDLANKK